MYLNVGLQLKTGIQNRSLSACVQDTTEPVFSVEESLKITGAVVLFEGLLGEV